MLHTKWQACMRFRTVDAFEDAACCVPDTICAWSLPQSEAFLDVRPAVPMQAPCVAVANESFLDGGAARPRRL